MFILYGFLFDEVTDVLILDWHAVYLAESLVIAAFSYTVPVVCVGKMIEE
jgi:hypothetical protein